MIKAYKYKYNSLSRTCIGSKELQDELDLDWYDYSARNYDAALGRFMNVEPLTEKYNFQSPYVYADNNPIFFVDINGMGVDPPLKEMKIRRNRASNLGPGMLRNGGSRFHAGHDLYAAIGSTVMAVQSGNVIKVGVSNSYGNYITIKHKMIKQHCYTAKDGTKYNWSTSETKYSFYAHLDSTSVSEGETVSVGQKIGEVGTSGSAKAGSDGKDVHLHIEWGSELRGNESKMLKKSSLENPNNAYKTVKFESKNSSSNQTNTGIIKTEYNEINNQKYESKFYYDINQK